MEQITILKNKDNILLLAVADTVLKFNTAVTVLGQIKLILRIA